MWWEGKRQEHTLYILHEYMLEKLKIYKQRQALNAHWQMVKGQVFCQQVKWENIASSKYIHSDNVQTIQNNHGIIDIKLHMPMDVFFQWLLSKQMMHMCLLPVAIHMQKKSSPVSDRYSVY